MSDNSKKNFYWYVGAFFANAFITLGSTPFLVAGLGALEFGILKTIQKLFDVASVADGRSSQVLKMIIARQRNLPNGVELNREAIGCALVVWVFYLPLVIISLGGLWLYLNSGSLLVPLEHRSGSVLLFICLSVIFVLSPLTTIPDAVLMGVDRGYKSIGMQVAWMMFSTLGFVLVASLGYGLDGIGYVSLSSAILAAISMCSLLVKVAPWVKIKKPSFGSVRDQLKLTLGMNVWLLLEKLLLSVDLILIGRFCGGENAGAYSLMSYGAQLIIALTLVIGASVTPSLAARALENIRAVSSSVILLRQLVFLFSLVLVILFIIFNKLFITVWVGDNFFISNLDNALIAVGALLTSCIRCEAQLQDVMLAVRERLTYAFGCLALGLTASFIYGLSEYEHKFTIILFISVCYKLLVNGIYVAITNRLFEIKLVASKTFVSGYIVLMLFVFGAIFYPPSGYFGYLCYIILLVLLGGIYSKYIIDPQLREMIKDRFFKSV